MALKNVILEYRHTPQLHQAFSMALRDPSIRTSDALPKRLPGIEIDHTFVTVPIPSAAAARDPNQFLQALTIDPVAPASVSHFLARGILDEDARDEAVKQTGPESPVAAIWSDPTIAPCFTCGSSPAQGNADDIASLLGVQDLASRGMDGSNVLLAIVDTGINLDFLVARGLNPKTNVPRSWVPSVPPPNPAQQPFKAPVNHGTMCAFDALIAAPQATLLDIAVLASRRHGATVMDGLLSDAVLGYAFLLRVVQSLGFPGPPQSLVVSNSWGMFNSTSDFPVGDPGNYSDNPLHPFSRIVGTLEHAGADILFAAGNCGPECPDSRCAGVTDGGIYGANSHPKVLSIAGVDVEGERVGYSTKGPGRLEEQKPDVAGFTHFAGSEVEDVDSGTSAATPVVAGLVAAIRTRFPAGPNATPEMLRDALRATAKNPEGQGFNNDYGFGVVDGPKLARMSALTGGEGGPVLEDAPEPTQEERENDMNHQDEFFKALEAFGHPAPQTMAQPSAQMSVLPADICTTYTKVKPILEGVLPILRAIPGAGPAIAAGVQALMAALDSLCGTSTSAALVSSHFAASGSDREFFTALSVFQASTATAATPAVSTANVCDVYKKVKPILNGILPFLSFIPGAGPAVSAAIKALMAVLDGICH